MTIIHFNTDFKSDMKYIDLLVFITEAEKKLLEQKNNEEKKRQHHQISKINALKIIAMKIMIVAGNIGKSWFGSSLVV